MGPKIVFGSDEEISVDGGDIQGGEQIVMETDKFQLFGFVRFLGRV